MSWIKKNTLSKNTVKMNNEQIEELLQKIDTEDILWIKYRTGPLNLLKKEYTGPVRLNLDGLTTANNGKEKHIPYKDIINYKLTNFTDSGQRKFS